MMREAVVGPGEGRGVGWVAPGEVLLSVSGRLTAPVPKFKLATNAGCTRAVRALAEWLVSEARAEVESTGNDWGVTMLGGMNPKNMSQADYDTANLFLFGDADGPGDVNRLAG